MVWSVWVEHPPETRPETGEPEIRVQSHLFLVAMPLFLIANIVTTSKALVTRSDALVPSSLFVLL